MGESGFKLTKNGRQRAILFEKRDVLQVQKNSPERCLKKVAQKVLEDECDAEYTES